MDTEIMIVNQLSEITEQLREFNVNFLAAQSPPVPGRLTKEELHKLLIKIQDEITIMLDTKLTEGVININSYNETKQIVAQVMWNTDLEYEYREV